MIKLYWLRCKTPAPNGSFVKAAGRSKVRSLATRTERAALKPEDRRPKEGRNPNRALADGRLLTAGTAARRADEALAQATLPAAGGAPLWALNPLRVEPVAHVTDLSCGGLGFPEPSSRINGRAQLMPAGSGHLTRNCCSAVNWRYRRKLLIESLLLQPHPLSFRH